MKIAAVILLMLATSAAAQSGGPYTVTQSVIAGGGSQNAAGGAFGLEGTAGQSIAGTQSTGGPFSVIGGFWAEQQLAPTAANVTLSGRVLLSGDGMRRVTIMVQSLSTGIVRSTTPNQMGHYSFDQLEIGLYLIRAESPNFQFTPNDVVVTITEDVTILDFTGSPL